MAKWAPGLRAPVGQPQSRRGWSRCSLGLCSAAGKGLCGGASEGVRGPCTISRWPRGEVWPRGAPPCAYGGEPASTPDFHTVLVGGKEVGGARGMGARGRAYPPARHTPVTQGYQRYPPFTPHSRAADPPPARPSPASADAASVPPKPAAAARLAWNTPCPSRWRQRGRGCWWTGPRCPRPPGGACVPRAAADLAAVGGALCPSVPPPEPLCTLCLPLALLLRSFFPVTCGGPRR